jgi:lipoprotein-releasing system permease protein
MGIDPATHFKTTNFASSLYYRKDEPNLAFVPSYNDTLPGCVIGIDLIEDRDEWGNYKQWEFLPRNSYEITCFPLTPKGTIVRTGTSVSANTKTFYYSDNSNTGLAKVDGTTVFLDLPELQNMTGMNIEPKRTSAIFIKFKKGYHLERAVEKTNQLWKNFTAGKINSAGANLFKNVNVQDFKSYKRDTIAPMEKERAMMLLLFLMVGLITVFIIFVIFYMIIGRKNKDIGILKSIGASGFGITQVFLRYAVLIGIVGAVIGIAAALIFLDNMNDLEGWLFYKFGFQVWNREIYAIGEIPSKPGVALPVEVAVASIIACLLGAAVPTIRAARQNCVDILRVNNI